MQNPIHQLLDKEMDRREFLVHLGASLMMVVGFSSIFKALNGSSAHRTGRSSTDYGGGPYGV